MKQMMKDKRGIGVVSAIVGGVASLVILVIVSLLIVSTLNSAGLLTAGSNESIAVDNMIANYTKGIDNVSGKIPTILLIAAVVILFGAIVLLVRQSQQVTGGAGGGL